MKNLKKIISISLCFIMTAVCTVPAMAADSLPETGLIWDTWESYLQDMDESMLRRLATQRFGDIDGDGRVSASDARLCLRSAANLEELTENQRAAADINNDIVVNSADARMILRAAASIEALADTSIETTIDWGWVIGPVKTSGSAQYFWHCSVDNDEGLEDSVHIIDSSSPEVDGATSETFFVFTPKAAGAYTIEFKLANASQDDVLDEFKVNVLVNENSVSISEGEQYRFEGLKNAGSGRYNWKCTVTPDTGLEVKEDVVQQENAADGAPVEQIFTFTGNEKGTYEVHFELIASGEEKPINEFYFEVIVE